MDCNCTWHNGIISSSLMIQWMRLTLNSARKEIFSPIALGCCTKSCSISLETLTSEVYKMRGNMMYLFNINFIATKLTSSVGTFVITWEIIRFTKYHQVIMNCYLQLWFNKMGYSCSIFYSNGSLLLIVNCYHIISWGYFMLRSFYHMRVCLSPLLNTHSMENNCYKCTFNPFPLTTSGCQLQLRCYVYLIFPILLNILGKIHTFNVN